MTFVPAQGFVGTVTVSYAGYSASGSRYNVKVSPERSVPVKGIRTTPWKPSAATKVSRSIWEGP